MKKFVLAPALAALAMFVFGAVYWMSPFPYQTLGRVADDDDAAQKLASIFPATGTYLIPGAYLDSATATRLFERGPSAEVQFVKEGHPAMEASVMVKGYLHYFLVALLFAIAASKAAPSFKGYGCVVKFCTFIGVIGVVFLTLSNPIWWHHPWGWHLVDALYGVIASAIAGLVLGKFFAPKSSPPPAAV